MKKIILTLTLGIASVFSFSQTFKINTEKAVVSFNYYEHGCTGTVKGISGEILFDVTDLTKSVITGTADAKTITTDNKKRDEHLQESDYFDVAKYPTMSFKSTSITTTETGYDMKGLLTIKGIEKEVSFTFTFTNNIFEGKAAIYTNDYGISVMKKREDSKVGIKVYVPVI